MEYYLYVMSRVRKVDTTCPNFMNRMSAKMCISFCQCPGNFPHDLGIFSPTTTCLADTMARYHLIVPSVLTPDHVKAELTDLLDNT